MNETVRESPGWLVDIEYFPSIPVDIPWVLSLKCTLAKGIGWALAASTTLPEIWVYWALADPAISTPHTKSKHIQVW